MAENNDRTKEEKTEEPTPYRLRKAREEGNVAKSTDLNSAAILLSSLLLFYLISGTLMENITNSFQRIFTLSSNFELNINSFLLFAPKIILYTLSILFPIFGTLFLVGLLINFIQTGFVFATKPLNPDFSRINPVNGFKKLFSLKNLFEVVKTILKISIVGVIAYLTLKSELGKILSVADRTSWQIFKHISNTALTLGFRCGFAILILAIIDFIYQRYDYRKNLRMTPQEVREEQKELIGNPEIRRKIRKIQIILSRRRMMRSVPDADVILTNPTHYAIALKYDPKKMSAPMVLAKGKLKIAIRIAQIAKENNIPVLEKPELTRSLFPVTEVGKEIPAEFYEIVAEILAQIYKRSGKANSRMHTT
ncbi:MAG: flagellar biosynthesis protein FlhB [Candidatus Cloacimonadota bacterium]|nr:flagellar biosynthesis protein FlhB [Candidatus Cloacimonadota bacterium]